MSEVWNWGVVAPLLPEIFLSLSALALLVAGTCRIGGDNRLISWLAVGALVVTGVILLAQDWDGQPVLGDMFVLDGFAGFMKSLLLVGLIASLLLSVRNAEQENVNRPEYPVLMLLSGIGMMVMISSSNMLSMYVGFELQSLCLYVLAAFRRDHVRSSEAGLKYFVLGALASGLMLFGISIIYGFTGSISFAGIDTAIAGAGALSMAVIFGLVFILTGIGFKISAVPFHMWTPDVYEGAPTSTTALFAIAPKLAAMAVLIRVLFEAFGSVATEWQQIIWFLAAASMFWSAFAGLRQSNIKRLMAYSSIGNMGYALLGVIAANEAGISATIVYLAIYMAMTAGVFAVLMTMRRDELAAESITDLSGLSRTNPALAYSMAILMFSMSGIPPLAGFFGKLVVFQAAISAGFVWLSVIGVLTSVVASYYYLRIIKVMFFDEPHDAFDRDMPFARRIVLAVSIAFTLFFIARPNMLMDASHASASVLLNR